nr:metallophosphoesterase, DNA ligase-associated [uncultured bacterium]
MSDIMIELAGEEVALLPERALWWPRMAMLFVADTHWGKAATFRAAGIALPGGTTTGDLARLSSIIRRTGVQRLVLLGDLLHAKAGRAWQTLDAITAWRSEWPDLEVLLVRGNHDRHAGDPPSAWRFTVVDAPHAMVPFVLLHQPNEQPHGYALAGHIHPGARIQGAGRQRLHLPCFWFGAHVGVLPSFGSFTGMALVTPAAGDRVYVIADDAVLALH